ncbi:MAG: glycosyltransferase family 4 protein [Armatimonadetes bacterium]|nr:glycosyltransferase family 4 protein [Armatimonadota bacterium]
MKILFLTAEPPWPLDQGDKLRNYNLLRCLAKRHQVSLATFVDGRDVGEWRRPLEEFCGDIHAVTLSRKMMIGNALRLPHLPVTAAARASRRMAFFLRNLTRQEKYDLVIACQLKMAGFLSCCFVPGKVFEMTDVLSIYRARLGRVARGPGTRIFSIFEQYKLAFWEPRYARLADLVLLASPFDAEFLRAKIKTPVQVLPNGVDTEYFRPLPDADEPVLIFYGHLRYPPNADGIVYFCRAIFPEVKRVVPEAKLLIAGKEPPPEVRALSRDRSIELPGYVPDLRAFLARSAVVICPVRAGAGTRLKILEALACGKPVVSTSIGCAGLAVEPGKHLEVADEPADFASKVVELLNSREKRSFLARQGRSLVEARYSWEAIGERLNTLIEGVF